MTGVQALERLHPTLPMKPGRRGHKNGLPRSCPWLAEMVAGVSFAADVRRK
ncbi:hypothetical protein [Paenibacillus ginsengihumi]|uniref:hypothetical protein n=1 Tax=Paenibacillus ginsengihumi TaxID=431596 RepID=UPI0012EC8E37|nr:hypothetical protein [Paenibacillus ginsengihumi]